MPNFDEKTTGDSQYLLPSRIVNEFLRDENGSFDCNVDGSSTPIDFGFTVPNYKNAPPWVISNLAFVINDNSIVLATKFAGIGGGLTNGLSLRYIQPDAERELFLFGVRFNLDFALYSNAGTIGLDRQGSGDDSLSAIVSSPGSGYRVLLLPGDRVVMRVADDLSSITRFNVVAHGFVRTS